WGAARADCDKLKDSGPDICVIDTRFERAGRVSVSTTFWAAEGPLLVSVIVSVALVPAVTDPGRVAVTATSAELAGVLGAKLATAVPQLVLSDGGGKPVAGQNV